MKRLYVAMILMLTMTFVMSANVSLSINAPGRVQVGQKFPVILVLKNAEVSPSNLRTPQINGCKYIFGPTTTTFQSYQNINGRAESSSSVEFTYTYLAQTEGTQTIPPVTVTINGRKYTTKATIINIAPADSKSQNSGRQSGGGVSVDDISTQTSDKQIGSNDVIVRISTSRTSAYEQEAIECTIKLYTKYNISEFMPITQPAFNGFLVEDLPIQSSLNARETLNGQEYATAVVKKCILFPQKSGQLTIVSGTYDLTVVQYDNLNLGFYQAMQPRTKKIRVNSNSASVNVLPLPSPQPAGFTGAVGQFTASSRLSTTSFLTNDPATLTYEVSGIGNIRYVKDPEIDFPVELEQYSPQHNVDAKVVGNSVQGKSTIDITFIPKETGNFTINVPDFVYFDPGKKEYVIIPGKKYDIKVSKGLSAPVADKRNVTSKNTDILFIKLGDKGQTMNMSYALNQWWYWIIYLLLVLGVVGLLAYNSISSKRAMNVVGMRMSKANKVARKRLRLARKYMEQHNAEKFYEETLRAVWGYLSDKLSIPVADLSRSSIESQLINRGADGSTCAEFIEVLDACEMARYTPSDNPGQIESVYDRTCDAIDSLEKTKLTK